MSRIPLRESAEGIADATGRATATLQPLRAFERWEIRRTSVASTSETLKPSCRIYRGAVSAGNLIEGTYVGTQDSSATPIVLENGECLIAVWEGKQPDTAGVDVGAICTLTIEGEAVRAV